VKQQDAVDRVLEQWQRERPDLDRSPMAVVGRISRLAALLDRELDVVFERYGLTGGEFDVLATLRRSAPDEGLTPTDLAQSTMVSTGGMTKRLDALERRGLIRRDPCEDDRRSIFVVLTPQGRALIDEAVVAHVENEERLLAGLTKRDRDRLAGLLRALALGLDRA
jgi:DNA-binding MarR family transcriptional regulator